MHIEIYPHQRSLIGDAACLSKANSMTIHQQLITGTIEKNLEKLNNHLRRRMS